MKKNQAQYIFRAGVVLLCGLVLYTRFVNLGWGLPYPMHPDERNMAVSLLQLSCDTLAVDVKESTVRVKLPLLPEFGDITYPFRAAVRDCFHPHFFAYGQFPMYLGYALVMVYKIGTWSLSTPVSLVEATMALRVISAVSSVLTVGVLSQLLWIMLTPPENHAKKKKKKGEKADSNETDFARLHHQELLHSQHETDISPFETHEDKNKDNRKSKKQTIFADRFTVLIVSVLFVFSPGLIQFAHFGTTESLLMLVYAALVYECVRLVQERISLYEFVFTSALISGVAIATKISAGMFVCFVFFFYLVYHISFIRKIKLFYLFQQFVIGLIIYSVITLMVGIVLSPYSFLLVNETVSTIQYESSVAMGGYVPFYTRQFVDTIPGAFQAFYTFPYVFGFGVFVLGLLGFFGLSWLRKDITILRFAVLFYFAFQITVFAKWSRFMSPLFPLFILFAAIMLYQLVGAVTRMKGLSKVKLRKSIVSYSLTSVLVIFLAIPGVAYLSVYTSEDVRFTASRWIFENIPEGSHILSETANVIDIPIKPPMYEENTPLYTVKSFNFYELHAQRVLISELRQERKEADYILVPSRRIFSNHTCTGPDDFTKSWLQNAYESIFSEHIERMCREREQTYQVVNSYYQDLFSGELGFEHVKTFSSFPKISLFGQDIYTISDEAAEETWTVFDHPVIRVYEKRN